MHSEDTHVVESAYLCDVLAGRAANIKLFFRFLPHAAVCCLCHPLRRHWRWATAAKWVDHELNLRHLSEDFTLGEIHGSGA